MNIRSAVLAAIASSSIIAQTHWVQVSTVPGNLFACATYDDSRDQYLVVGASTPNTTLLFDGTNSTWTTISGRSPNAGQLACDALRQRIVANFNGQTWEWDGMSWTLVTLQGPNVGNPGIAWHAGRSRVMLFGGYTVDPYSQFVTGHVGLWEWDGSSWTLVPVNSLPPWRGTSLHSARVYHSLAYDARRDKLVVFGEWHFQWPGHNSGTNYPVTWEWDAPNHWQQINAGGVPAYGPFWDAARASLLVETDQIGGGTTMMEWNGTGTWAAVGAPAPGTFALQPSTVAYDSRRQRLLGIDATGRVWAYQPDNPATVAQHGSGCSGALGVPTITPTARWTLPWIGQSMSLDLSNLPQGIALLTAGLQDRFAGTAPLPFDLTPFGAPGCFLRVSPDTSTFAFGTGNRATVALGIPNDLNLVGASILQQALVIDPDTNTTGVVISDSVRVTVGRAR